MEAVGRLAGGIAHDFNNMLTVIIGYSNLMLNNKCEHCESSKDLKEILKAGEFSAQLTQQLLAFSRKQVLRQQVLDINRTVEHMNQLLRRTLGERISLATMLDAQIGRLRVDPGQLEQVVVNLPGMRCPREAS
jgi:signal transduction histidine kinase